MPSQASSSAAPWVPQTQAVAHDVAVGGQGRQVTVVDRGVGVLLRIEDPDHQIGQPHQPVDLEVVGDLGGVVVGQVEEHDALELLVGPTAVEHRVTDDAVTLGDAEPLQQLVGALGAPDAGGRPGRRLSPHADGGQVEPDQRVERGGLTGAGGASERDHGVVGRELEPRGGPLHEDQRSAAKRRSSTRRAAVRSRSGAPPSSASESSRSV